MLTVMSFIFSALIGAPSGLANSFPGAAELLSGGVLIPLPIQVREFVDTAGFFGVVRHCSFDPVQAYLAYRRANEVDWDGVNCAGWFPYKGQTGEVMGIPARQVPGTKRDRDGVLISELVPQVVASYVQADRLTLDDAQITARRALGGNEQEDNGSEDSDDAAGDPGEEETWDFRDIQMLGRRGVSALQAIRDYCTRCDENEPDTLTEAQLLI